MKTKYRLIVILIISLTNTLFADGPPIDSTGKLSGKYISITLDSNQIKHLQTNRYLELTKEQIDEIVKSLSGRHFGEPRIRACPGPRSGIRGRRRGPELLEFSGFPFSRE